MIGGCSSHNGCAAIWGSRLDYDAFAAGGMAGWSRAEVEPLLRAASERMRVRIPEEAELAPFHRAALASLTALGVPRVHDLNDLDAVVQSSHITADDLATIAADRKAIEADKSNDIGDGSSDPAQSGLPFPLSPGIRPFVAVSGHGPSMVYATRGRFGGPGMS